MKSTVCSAEWHRKDCTDDLYVSPGSGELWVIPIPAVGAILKSLKWLRKNVIPTLNHWCPLLKGPV